MTIVGCLTSNRLNLDVLCSFAPNFLLLVASNLLQWHNVSLVVINSGWRKFDDDLQYQMFLLVVVSLRELYQFLVVGNWFNIRDRTTVSLDLQLGDHQTGVSHLLCT